MQQGSLPPPPPFIQRSRSNSRLSVPAAPVFPSNAPFTMDDSLAPGQPARLQPAHSPHPYIGQGQAVQLPPSTSSHPMDPSMITLLQTLRGTGSLIVVVSMMTTLWPSSLIFFNSYTSIIKLLLRLSTLGEGSSLRRSTSCARMPSLPSNRGDVLPS